MNARIARALRLIAADQAARRDIGYGVPMPTGNRDYYGTIEAAIRRPIPIGGRK